MPDKPYRVPPRVYLPSKGLDPHVKLALTQALELHASSINHAWLEDITRVSAAATIGHDIVLVDATNTATVVLTLIPANNFINRVMRIKQISTGGTVLIVPQSGETLDEGTTATMSAIGSSSILPNATLISDGDEWYVI